MATYASWFVFVSFLMTSWSFSNRTWIMARWVCERNETCWLLCVRPQLSLRRYVLYDWGTHGAIQTPIFAFRLWQDLTKI